MRLSKKDYKLLGYLILVLSLCWGTRSLLFLRPSASFPLTLKWRTDLGNSTYDRPAYQDGLVLSPASRFLSNHWYGVEAETGQVAWFQRDGWWYKSFHRCLTSEYLIISGISSFMALEIRTGKIVWSKDIANTATCSETTVFAIVNRSDLRAFDLFTGHEIWAGTRPWQPFSGSVYNPKTDKLLAGGAVVVDPISGRILHSFDPLFVGYPPNDNGHGPVLITDRGELFIGGTVRDAQTGQIIHKEEAYSSDIPPTVTAEAMYLSAGQVVVAFDRAGYEVKWVYKPPPQFGALPVYPLSPVTVLDQIGYVIYSDATLRAIDLETGQEAGYWQPGWVDRFFWPACVPFSFPFCVGRTGIGATASDNSLFVSFGNGKFYAFGKNE